MVLVPEVVLNELKGKLPKPPEFQSTIGLRSGLDDIEHREDFNPEEKLALYGHQLHRYREYLQARQPGKPATPPPAKPPEAGVPAAPPTPPVPPPVAGAAPVAGVAPDLEQQILESVNKPGQKKAQSLLKHLKNSKVLTWTPEGEISYRGRAIPHSNIVVLMTEAQRQKPLKHSALPPGFDEFAQALKETNKAKTWLTNPALIKAMEKQGKISTPKPVDESGFQEASLDQSFYETTRRTPRRMTPDYVKRASKKSSENLKRWLHLPDHPE
jgi:SOS-response transcriptional repressor LexA